MADPSVARLASDPRFTRQTRLAEVGEEGQARLGAVRARVAGSGTPARVEEKYLVGAGVLAVSDPAPFGDPVALPAFILSLHPAARDVAEGAYAALDVIRAVLEGAAHPRVQPR